MQLTLIALALLLTTEADAPKRIESITEWNIQEASNKMAIKEHENEIKENKIKYKMFQYVIKHMAQWRRIKRTATVVDAIYATSKGFDLPIALIMAIIEVESLWRPEVISHKGARGLMQIMPVWDQTLIIESIIESPEQIFDIARNIRAAGFVIRRYLNYQTENPLSDKTRLDLSLDDYSGGGGDKYINKVREKMKQIEEFLK